MRRPRPYRREPRALVLLSACALLIVWRVVTLNDTATEPELLQEGIHEVRRVVDGDTLLLESGARVRLQGIDTPETVDGAASSGTLGPGSQRVYTGFH